VSPITATRGARPVRDGPEPGFGYIFTMAHVGWVNWNLVLLSAFASAALGCSDGSAGPSNTGVVVSEQKLSCAAPACCQPMDIDAKKIIVYQANGAIGLDIILNLPEALSNPWSASVEVSLSWGGSVTCTTTVSDHSQKFVALACPSLQVAGAPACDSTVTLGLHPTTSTYADVAGTQAVCTGKPGALAEFAVPLTCPTCPVISGSGFDPCYFPNATCYYSAYTPSGSATLPCRCDMNGVDGDRRWSCAVP